ncbi:MAG: hypothetical protein KBF88_15260 [Polyangiaceae bacterium]|nr:hypothetical protein [Polyangiaceae bacterium]
MSNPGDAGPQSRSRLAIFASALLVVLSIGFRWPALLNADATNSDAAIVGLQALHILEGEWTPYLWGSGYQSSIDSVIAALWMALFGKSTTSLMASSLACHIVLALLGFDLLRRSVGVWRALVLALLWVFTTACVHGYALYPPRQASLTLVFVSWWLVSRKRLSTGALVAGLAAFADPLALVFLPSTALVLTLSSAESTWRQRWHVLGALTIGLVPFMWLRMRPDAKGGALGFELTLDRIVHNGRIFLDSAFPWTTGTKIFAAKTMMDYVEWPMHPFVRGVCLAGLGILLFALGLVVFRLVRSAGRERASFFRQDLPANVMWSWVAASGILVSIAAFLVSVMVFDHFSMRYLIAWPLMLPLMLGGVVDRVWLFRASTAFAIFMGAVGGWVSFRPATDGAHVSVAPSIRDAHRVIEILRREGIHFAVADYWSSYRMTLLSKEDPIVIPSHASQDRYAPYRDRFAKAERVAWIHDEERSDQPLLLSEARAQAFCVSNQRFSAGTFTVWICVPRSQSSSNILPE